MRQLAYSLILGSCLILSTVGVCCSFFFNIPTYIPLRWASSMLTGEIVSQSKNPLQRAYEVFDLSIHDGVTQDEIRAILAEMQGESKTLLESEEFWDFWTMTYDQILAYNPKFIKLIEFTESQFPTEGLIADLGCGTGMFGTKFLRTSPDRHVIFVDISKQALSLGQEKVEQLEKEKKYLFDYTFWQKNLLDLKASDFPRKLSGAVLNNVLYAIPADNRIALLQTIYESLEPGGVLVLSEPSGDKLTDAKIIRTIFRTVLTNSILNNSPITDFQLAFNHYVGTEVIPAEPIPFMTRDQLLTMIQKAGFKITSHRDDLYYGVVNTFVLQK